jgi:hypothetical protein
MRILITELQLRKVIKEHNNNPIIKIGIIDGEVMIKFRNTLGEIFAGDYDDFIEEYETNYIVDYYKSKNLTLSTSKSLREIVRNNPNNDNYSIFLRDENGKPYPEMFIGNYIKYYGGDREERNKMLRRINRVINEIYESEYPITVYRGIQPKENINRDNKGNYWSRKKSVAMGFGSRVYVGLIKSREDISLSTTIRSRMTWPEEYEIYVEGDKIEIIDDFFTKK